MKKLVAKGKLGKYGKILDTTPADVREEFALKQGGTETTSVETLCAATAVAATSVKVKKELTTTPSSAAGRKVRASVDILVYIPHVHGPCACMIYDILGPTQRR